MNNPEIKNPIVFDHRKGALQMLLCDKSERFVLNSLEILDYKQFVYRSLKSSGFEIIVFIDLMDSKNISKCQVVTYDKKSYCVFNYPELYKLHKKDEDDRKFYDAVIKKMNAGQPQGLGNNQKQAAKKELPPEFGMFAEGDIDASAFQMMFTSRIRQFFGEGFEGIKIAIALTASIIKNEALTDTVGTQLKAIIREQVSNMWGKMLLITVDDFSQLKEFWTAVHNHVPNKYAGTRIEDIPKMARDGDPRKLTEICRAEDDELRNLLMRFKMLEPGHFNNYSHDKFDMLIKVVKKYAENIVESSQRSIIPLIADMFEYGREAFLGEIHELMSKNQAAVSDSLTTQSQSETKAALDIKRLPRIISYKEIMENELNQEQLKRQKLAEINSEEIAAAIKSQIIGQDDNIDAVCAVAIRHIRNTDPSKPATMLILGTTGVGKSETFKLLSEELKKYGIDIGDLIEVPLSEYTDKADVNKLKGSPPGYRDSGEPTILDKLHGSEYNLVVFNEMEKAHEDVWKYLMEMIDRGIYVSQHHKGEIVCKKTVFAFTSNLIIDEKQYHTIPESAKRNDFLARSIIDEMTQNNIPTSLSEPYLGRMKFRRLYNSIQFMSAEEQLRIVVNSVKVCFSRYHINVMSVEPNLIVELYEPLMKNIRSGIRGVIDFAEQLLGKAIDKYADEFYKKDVMISGTLESPLVKEAFENDLEQCMSRASDSIKMMPSQRPQIDRDKITFELKKRIIGQDKNITAVCSAVFRHINNPMPKKPLTMLILGTTGVGKTESFHILSGELSKQGINIGNLIEVPLNEYINETDVNRLKGSPPGYVGYGEPTNLDKLRDSEYNLVLFNEMEKAHSAVWQYLMELIDQGVYVSQKYGRIECKKAVFAFTSNLIIDERQYHMTPDLERNEFLARNIIMEMTRSGVPKSLSEPFVGRIKFRRIYNSIPFMSAEEKLRLTVNAIKACVSEHQMNVISIEPSLVAELYVPLINNVKTGVRGMIHFAEQLLGNEIDKCADDFYEKNVRLSGTLSNPLIEEAFDHDLIQCLEVAKGLIDETTEPNQPEKPFEPLNSGELSQLYAKQEPVSFYDAIQSFYERLEGALLYIEADLVSDGKGYGSGFLISPDGYAITCNHVIDKANKTRARVKIKGRPGGDISWHDVEIIKTVPGMDLALIKLEGKNFPYMKVSGIHDEITLGQEVVIMGYPFGERTQSAYTAFEGKIASVGQSDQYGERCFIGGEAKRGNSGGPVILKETGVVSGVLLGSITEGDERLREEINYMRPAKYFWELFTK